MSKDAVIVAAAGVAAVGAGIGVVKLVQYVGRGAALPLSPRRRFVLASLASVVPSQYGDNRFARIAPSYDPDDPKLPRNAEGKLIYTTCGELPCFIGRELGVKNCITQGGLESMRLNGRKAGFWVDATGKNLPRPGDLFGIDSNGPPGSRIIVHVGAIVDANEKEWKTADAGQGGIGAGQSAAYLTRPYDPKTNTLGGPGAVYVAGTGWTVRGKARYVGGWVDIDKVAGAKP